MSNGWIHSRSGSLIQGQYTYFAGSRTEHRDEIGILSLNKKRPRSAAQVRGGDWIRPEAAHPAASCGRTDRQNYRLRLFNEKCGTSTAHHLRRTSQNGKL